MSAAAAEVSLFNQATLVDPYAAYKTLRDQAPVHYEPALNVHVVTRYDLVREAIRDTQTFSSEFGNFLDKSREIAFAAAPSEVQQRLREINERMIELPPTMLTLDEPAHTRYRSLVGRLFTGSEVKKSQTTVQGVIDRNIQNLLDAPADGAGRLQAEFMSAFAFRVPLRIIGDRLGIPERERPFFDEAATAAAAGLRLSPLTPEQMIHRGELALRLQELLVSLVEARRRTPQDDMISILANSELAPVQGDPARLLSHGEALSVLQQFLVAGHETTTSAFGWGMLLLCRNPAIQSEIRGDAALVRTFVEEALRMEAPVQGLPRLVTKDTELGGFPLPAGSMIMLRFGAANRDERQFEAPDQVDVHRPKAGMQLAFGSGVHHCIGAPLARQELNLGFAALLDRFEDFRVAEGAEPEAEPSFILRNLPKLPICYRVRR